MGDSHGVLRGGAAQTRFEERQEVSWAGAEAW